MLTEDLAMQILAHAFRDEMEKIAVSAAYFRKAHAARKASIAGEASSNVRKMREHATDSQLERMEGLSKGIVDQRHAKSEGLQRQVGVHLGGGRGVQQAVSQGRHVRAPRGTAVAAGNAMDSLQRGEKLRSAVRYDPRNNVDAVLGGPALRGNNNGLHRLGMGLPTKGPPRSFERAVGRTPRVRGASATPAAREVPTFGEGSPVRAVRPQPVRTVSSIRGAPMSLAAK